MTHNVPWTPFSGGDSAPPAELEGAGIVALVPTGDEDWPAWAALELGRAVARSGRRVFLCDLGLAAPRLHTVAGVPRGEGVTDFVLYGASPARVATELEERLLFVSAGTPVSAIEAVNSSDRWDGFLDALSHAGACVMLFLPADAPEARRMFGRADSMVVLGSRDRVPVLDDMDSYRAIGLEPAPEPEPFVEEAAKGGEGSPVAASPGLSEPPDDRWELDPAAIGPDPDDEPVMTAERASAMNRAARLSPPRKSRLGLWFFIIFVLLVALVAAGWYGFIDVPGISPRRTAGAAAVPVDGTREASAQPAERGEGGSSQAEMAGGAPAEGTSGSAAAVDVESAPLQAWGLRIGAFRNRAVAREQADLMTRRAPTHLFVVVPVEVQQTVWFRVVSAAAEQQADAEAMRGDLATRLGTPDADQWLVRRAPLAFLLGEAATLEQARARIETLGAAGVDAFALAIPGSTGPAAFRIYAGAYANPTEASTMRALLDAAGITDAPLVERRGIQPG